jgi:hypothetical protein
MRAVAQMVWVLLFVMMAGAWPASAQITADLANKCRAMMLQAHPTEVFGSKGVAAAQRTYFQDCVRRKGDTPAAGNTGENQPKSTNK